MAFPAFDTHIARPAELVTLQFDESADTEGELEAVDEEDDEEGTEEDDSSNIDIEGHGEDAEASIEDGMAITLHFLLES